MKTKRVLLHVLILLLAVICMGAGMYVGYWESRDYHRDYEDEYNYDYAVDAWTILEYGYAQAQMTNVFGDENKILIENKEFGNVTVKDIVEIFEDKYSYYYDTYYQHSSFSDYEDFLVYEEHDEDIGVLYEMDKSYMNAYKNNWKENPSETLYKDKYLYYKAKCDYVDEYAKLAEILQHGMEQNGGMIGEISTSEFVNETFPYVFSGTKYYLKYTLNGQEYIVTNTDDINGFMATNGNGLVDITTVSDNGNLIQENPLYGTKDFIESAYSKEAVEFLKGIDAFYMGIDTRVEDSYFGYYMDKIREMPSDDKVGQIENRVFYCVVIIIVTLIIAFLMYIALMFIAGHRVKGDEAQLFNSDKQWWDVVVIALAVVGICAFWLVIDIYESGYYKMAAIIVAVLALPFVEAIIWLSESFMRRIKTKSFMKTTLFGILCKFTKRVSKKAKSVLRDLFGTINFAIKIIAFTLITIAWNGIAAFIVYENCDVMVCAAMIIIGNVILGAIVLLYFKENEKIKDGAKKISEGNIDYKIDSEMRFSANESLKNSINNIGDGLQNAISESIKNERMKTELIANVSHDLKTPLTSIINYVDLLKTEGVDSENAEKYLDVLDQKSQRLKQLTEDLVEVSKLNSGAVTMQLEKLDIVQLVKQSLGEFSEKFEEKNLQVVKNIQKEPILVMADGRKTWRLFENLYQNVYKYAMPGTRVYIDIVVECGKVTVSVKNISEGPLNFSADELMERFVRGDVSRTTEGSGLGLSIAQSIAQRQGGNMNIVLDGDLFKVEVMMNLA